MNKRLLPCLLAACGISCAAIADAATLTKAPDLGAYWHPLSSWGTHVYADSFIAPVTGTVTDLGTWLQGGSSSLVFEILADSGNAPDGASILASTPTLSFDIPNLTLEHAAPSGSATLIAGQEYWFAASTVGLAGTGAYDVGGHSQNGGGVTDDGSFWYANDAAGLEFDGQNLTPEMAFSVTVSPVPEPTTAQLLGLAVIGLAALRLRSESPPSSPSALHKPRVTRTG